MKTLLLRFVLLASVLLAAATPNFSQTSIDFYRPSNNVTCSSDPYCASGAADVAYALRNYTPATAPPSVPASAPSPAVGAVSSSAPGQVPSSPAVYMDYDAAVALGKKIIEQQTNPLATPSLGDAARQVRANRLNPSLTSAASHGISAIQDNQGQWIVCRSADTRCR